jgi:hypothetical protein
VVVTVLMGMEGQRRVRRDFRDYRRDVGLKLERACQESTHIKPNIVPFFSLCSEFYLPVSCENYETVLIKTRGHRVEIQYRSDRLNTGCTK